MLLSQQKPKQRNKNMTVTHYEDLERPAPEASFKNTNLREQMAPKPELDELDGLDAAAANYLDDPVIEAADAAVAERRQKAGLIADIVPPPSAHETYDDLDMSDLTKVPTEQDPYGMDPFDPFGVDGEYEPAEPHGSKPHLHAIRTKIEVIHLDSPPAPGRPQDPR
jgi:hypothetical protein